MSVVRLFMPVWFAIVMGVMRELTRTRCLQMREPTNAQDACKGRNTDADNCSAFSSDDAAIHFQARRESGGDEEQYAKRSVVD